MSGLEQFCSRYVIPLCSSAFCKVLNGQSWVLVDGAVLDVSRFFQRHPGGARLILNAVGTDVTHELLGQDLSVGHAMSFPPHVHQEVFVSGVHIFDADDVLHCSLIGYSITGEHQCTIPCSLGQCGLSPVDCLGGEPECLRPTDRCSAQ